MFIIFPLFGKWEYRAAASLKISPADHVDIKITPEVRFQGDGLDKYLAESEAEYDFFDFFEVGASYRLIVKHVKSEPDIIRHRLAAYVNAEIKIGRTQPSFRVMYNSYEEDEEISNIIRVKTTLDHNIPNSKIDPSIAAEIYHYFSTSVFYKFRYSFVLDWHPSGPHSVEFKYKLDDYMSSDKIRHLMEIEYEFEL